MAALGARHMMAEHREWLRMHARKAANAVQACADSCAMASDTCRALPATSDVHAAQWLRPCAHVAGADPALRGPRLAPPLQKRRGHRGRSWV